MRNVTRLFAAAGLLAASLTAAVADDKKDAGPFNDQQFVIKVTSDGMHEVELGKLAQTNASSADVKKFGERMVKDHTKAGEELKAAAQAAGIGIPLQMLPEHQKHVEKFKTLHGAEFDKAYSAHMVKDHEKAVSLFEKASKSAENPKIKEFATKTLPTIKEHLQMAKKLDGGKAAGASGGAATAKP
jgi:putative membrane protein